MEFDFDLNIKIRKLKFFDEAFLDFSKLKELIDKNVKLLDKIVLIVSLNIVKRI